MRQIAGFVLGVPFFVFSLFLTPLSHADETSEIQTLKQQVQTLQRTVEQLQHTIQTMQQRLGTPTGSPSSAQRPTQPQTPSSVESPLDRAVQELESKPPPQARQDTDVWSRRFGATNLRLLDLSLDALVAAGGSTRREAALQTLQGGGHDPRKRGFTLQNVELSLLGAVDPYFTAEAHLIYFIDPLEGESVFELEEAFLTTTSLPYGLQFEAGQFFTEFGQTNPRHPHAWDWQDQPVINTRLFGPDGMRGPGFRLGWLMPTPWFSELHFGMQNANGETMASFLASEEFYEERPIAGRSFRDRDVRHPRDIVYLSRWSNSWDLSDSLTSVVGFSGLYGPNATGPNGDTWIYGMDMKWRWRPVNNFRGWPFLLWQSEIMQRDFRADRFFDESNPDEVIDLPGRTLHDWGFYSQLLYGFHYGWAAGLRYEYAGGSGASLAGRKHDPFRADRQRVSPLLVWHPSEFSRIRLQYNFDYAHHFTGNRDAHSLWVGLEFLYGAHPAHSY
jgi:hypothetical protein